MRHAEQAHVQLAHWHWNMPCTGTLTARRYPNAAVIGMDRWAHRAQTPAGWARRLGPWQRGHSVHGIDQGVVRRPARWRSVLVETSRPRAMARSLTPCARKVWVCCFSDAASMALSRLSARL